METLAYLHVAQEYEDPQSWEFVVLDDLELLRSLRLSSSATLALMGLAGAIWVMNPADSAQAIPLYRGDSGSDVVYLQDILRELGYFSGTSTGFYGSVTESAVRQFQADYGLKQDGIAGDRTFAALENDFVPIYPGLLQFGETGAAVTDLQEALREAGYFFGASTGYFGSMTESAVIAFQQDNGLVADGLVGSATWEALGQGFLVLRPPGFPSRG